MGHAADLCVGPGSGTCGMYNFAFIPVDFSLKEAFDVNTRVQTV